MEKQENRRTEFEYLGHTFKYKDDSHIQDLGKETKTERIMVKAGERVIEY